MKRPFPFRKNKVLSIVIIIICIGTFFLCSPSAPPYQSYNGSVFGTTFHISYQSPKEFKDSIDTVLKEVDEALSMFNFQSIVSTLNNNESTKTNLLFQEVFNTALKVSAATDGYFDVTVAPLVNLWGFGLKNRTSVTTRQIDSIRTFIGYKLVNIEKNRIIKKDSRIQLDFSAIAKGFGVDQIAHLFNRNNINNYMIEIGGEIVTKGRNKENKMWTIGINKPIEDSTQTNQELQTVLQFNNTAMATSGNYRRFYTLKNGKKYAHTIDPHTGYPVAHHLLSATVFAPNCTTADAYATAFMAMGEVEAQKVLRHHPELKVFFILGNHGQSYKTWISPELKKHIVNIR